MIFDEFQSETNHYCTDEIRKFISVHTSVARGQGKQSRYVPVFMLSNPVSIINPYFAASYYKHLNPITIESQNTLKIPKGLMVAINGIIYTSTKDNILDVSAISNREGKDVYIYACQPSNGDEPVFVLSLNSTV